MIRRRFDVATQTEAAGLKELREGGKHDDDSSNGKAKGAVEGAKEKASEGGEKRKERARRR